MHPASSAPFNHNHLSSTTNGRPISISQKSFNGLATGNSPHYHVGNINLHHHNSHHHSTNTNGIINSFNGLMHHPILLGHNGNNVNNRNRHLSNATNSISSHFTHSHFNTNSSSNHSQNSHHHHLNLSSSLATSSNSSASSSSSSPPSSSVSPTSMTLANFHGHHHNSFSQSSNNNSATNHVQNITSNNSVQQNSSRYKTELCRPFEENGTCKYGEKCQFAHGVSELRTLTRHPKYKTEFCRTFHTTGFCPYGPRCHFIHNSKTSAVYQQPLSLKAFTAIGNSFSHRTSHSASPSTSPISTSSLSTGTNSNLEDLPANEFEASAMNTRQDLQCIGEWSGHATAKQMHTFSQQDAAFTMQQVN